MIVCAFLQNAWSARYAGRRWPRRSWLKALHSSRTGTRLRALTDACPNVTFWWDNTTPVVGATPDSKPPADPWHIVGVLNDHWRPDVVLAFGKQAAETLPSLWRGPLLILPHPTYRVVTNDLFREAGRLLNTRFTGTVTLTQGRGTVVVNRL